jgi:hypothetical protein
MRRPRSSLDAFPRNQKRLVAVEFGGGSLRNLLMRRIPGYLDNPLRQNMWRAGHAHPGVWLVLGLVGMLHVDQTPLSEGLKSLVRVTLLLTPILVTLRFFLSVLSPNAERPNGLINLTYGPLSAVQNRSSCRSRGSVRGEISWTERPTRYDPA